MGYKESYEQWLSGDIFDDDTKRELRAIAGNEKEIEDRFYRELEFGTAGLRGVIGAGTNRMNEYTVRKATQGLSNYINKVGGAERGVAIAYDCRRMSPEFADVAALCLAANGIKAFVFESLRPTPMLSYAVRKLGCIAGINITASHNPPEYNGYKVYWEDGAQITPPHDSGIMDEVAAITDFAAAKTISKQEAVGKGLYQVIGADIDDPYMEELKKTVLHQDAIDAFGKELVIVYTPLHGTGNIPVRRILKELGFTNVYVVPQQEKPDGEFPTVSYPNPEAREAFELALALGEEKKADLVLATDPDADRLGVYVRDAQGEYHCLTGNMSGCLIGDYVIGQRKERDGSLPENGAFIKSIVSTNLADAIAAKYGIELVEVLTGFKWIGRKALEYEQKGTGTYLFGMEESYGCLTGTYARDKDAVVASMALCEAAAYYRTKNKTLWDAMVDLYEELGYYLDSVSAITLKGKEGIEKIGSIMQELRANPLDKIGEYEVLRIRDYSTGEILDVKNGDKSSTGLPSSNVLYYELSDDAWVCVRPSGTEPKIKFYYGVKGDSQADADLRSASMKGALDALSDNLVNG